MKKQRHHAKVIRNDNGEWFEITTDTHVQLLKDIDRELKKRKWKRGDCSIQYAIDFLGR